MYTVYRRITPDGKSYIGCTSKSLEERAGPRGTGYVQNKVFYAAIEKFGWVNIQTEILATTESLEEAKNLETQFILQFDSKNPEHGYNAVDSGFSMDESRIKHLRKIGKENWDNPEVKARSIERRKKSITPEYRKRISESIKEKWKDPKYSEAVSCSMQEKWKDADYRASIHSSLKQYWTAEQRAKKSEEMKAVMQRSDVRDNYLKAIHSQEYLARRQEILNDPEIKARQVASMKKAWNAPGYREAMSQIMSAKRWINKGGINKRVDEEQLTGYLNAGWSLGRVTANHPEGGNDA